MLLTSMFLPNVCPVFRSTWPTLDWQRGISMQPCSFRTLGQPAAWEQQSLWNCSEIIKCIQYFFFPWVWNVPLIRWRYPCRWSGCRYQHRIPLSRRPLRIQRRSHVFFVLWPGHMQRKGGAHTKTFDPADCVCIIALASMLISSLRPRDRRCLPSSEGAQLRDSIIMNKGIPPRGVKHAGYLPNVLAWGRHKSTSPRRPVPPWLPPRSARRLPLFPVFFDLAA